MKNIFRIIAVLIILLNLYLGSWSVLNGDIYYDTDISRDFLIMDEIAQKKVVLIGPRADAEGIFHGPLWHYLNYPVFAISNGNPITVGYFWIFLTMAFLITSFFIAKQLFDETVAWIYTLFLSFYMVIYMRGYSHPIGVLFLMPLLFYFFSSYRRSKNIKNLTLMLFTAGLMTHLEIGAGAPFLVFVSLYSIFNILREKKFYHLMSFFILVIPFFSFIIFDLRHNFLQIKSVLNYALGARKTERQAFIKFVGDRLKIISFEGLNFFKNEAVFWNLIPSYIFAYFLFYFTRIKKDKFTTYYLSFLILFFGFHLVSLLHGRPLLIFYWLPLTPLIFLIFFSLLRHDNKKILIPLFILIFVFNFFYNISFLSSLKRDFIGKQHSSWKFHNQIAKSIFKDAPQTFGYFIYAPDFYGYAEKYAFRYQQKNSLKNPLLFQKEKVTYLVIEPPPTERPGLDFNWWKKNKLKISKSPVKTFSYANGFRIEKYNLTEEEMRINPDPETSYWLYFR